MDIITVTAVVIAVVATGTAWFLFGRARLLAQAVDEARARIGGNPPQRSWHRRTALEEALGRLSRSSAQAQKERSQLAGALQGAGEGIIITDDHGVVLFANQAAEQFLGARESEPIAQQQLRDAIERATLDRTSIAAQIEIDTPTQQILDIAAVPLDFGVESVGAVAYIRDLTEEHRIDAVRRDFVANVGFELRTPLATLASLSETLADSLNDPQVAGRMADRLRLEAATLRGLVDDILDLSQAEALASHDTPVQAGTIVSAVADLTAARATEHGVRLVVMETPVEARVSGDQRQLRTMLANLVDNAIKYSTPVPGQEAPRIWIRTAVTDSEVIFEVEDEGIGIADDHINRIFERFYRADRDSARSPGGTGLGLSIVRHIALNHRGTISVESNEGAGTTFTITLPRWRTS